MTGSFNLVPTKQGDRQKTGLRSKSDLYFLEVG